jgi:hypothetical protein
MNAMKHEDAIDTKAVERYLLGKMTPDEQKIFEAHYFDCADCAMDVTDGTRMMIAGRFVVEEELEEAEKRMAAKPVPSNVVPITKRFQWFPAAAAASLAFTLLGGEVGYLIATRSQPRETEIVRVVRLDTGVSRAGTPNETPLVLPGDDLRFDVEPSDEAVDYAAVVSCVGKTESTHGISREMAADAVTLRLGELPAGRCEVVVQGVRKDGKRFRITSSPFKVGER